MDADSFNDLALRVLAGEATDDEHRALEAELAATPARRDDFDQLKITHDVLRATAPLTEAARVTEPELPAYRRNELRTAVRQHFGPAANRRKETAAARTIPSLLRWIFAGGGLTVVGVAVVLLCFANRSVEIGLYTVDLVRNGDQAITAADVPTAKLVQFDYDAPFDQWQAQPLAWYQHAKIWTDNEHDLLYIVHRVRHGEVITETKPLAPTNEGQREQIKQAVAGLEK